MAHQPGTDDLSGSAPGADDAHTIDVGPVTVGPPLERDTPR